MRRKLNKKKKVIIGFILIIFIIIISILLHKKFFNNKNEIIENHLARYVTLGEYKGIVIEDDAIQTISVSSAEIEERIKKILEEKSKHVEVKGRAAKQGDTVIIDFAGFINDIQIDGASANGFYLTIGKGAFVEGFEESLIGLKIEETIHFKIQYPEKYENNPDIAGKVVDYSVKLNGIIENQIPELNDEFIKKSFNYKTVKEFEESIKVELETEKNEQLINANKERVWGQVVNNCDVANYPKEELAEIVLDINNYYKEAANVYGTDVETFKQRYLDDITEKEILDSAKEILKEKMIVSAIAQREKFTITDRELSKKAKELARKYNYKSGNAFIEGNGAEEIKKSMLIEKVKQFVFDRAKIKIKEEVSVHED